ncbi:hypothetical protein Lalb_Chr16g0391271 [Lupinus albus]|uniref:Uncharacterized protein n=1 Tax=Lupinus albus TaxID=3870 RepID=A0A6A4PCD3_LUPAL|nr:hypothetical protein Lalb_Chr16g0391271 [Lupinus albus]
MKSYPGGLYVIFSSWFLLSFWIRWFCLSLLVLCFTLLLLLSCNLSCVF